MIGVLHVLARKFRERGGIMGRFMKRSAFYRNLFNAETKFFQPKIRKENRMVAFRSL